MTGVRPRVSSMQARTTRSISAGVSEKNSPVPPAQQAGHLVIGQAAEVVAVGGFVDRVVIVEMLDGEGQEAGAENLRHLHGGHPCHLSHSLSRTFVASRQG